MRLALLPLTNVLLPCGAQPGAAAWRVKRASHTVTSCTTAVSSTQLPLLKVCVAPLHTEQHMVVWCGKAIHMRNTFAINLHSRVYHVESNFLDAHVNISSWMLMSISCSSTTGCIVFSTANVHVPQHRIVPDKPRLTSSVTFLQYT